MDVRIIQGILVLVAIAAQANGKIDCQLDPGLKSEIQSYQAIVNKIVDSSLNGEAKGLLYNNVVQFVDQFGPRLSGSDALEASIDYLIGVQEDENLIVSTHDVLVPKWERGEASAEILFPRAQKLTILALGNTLGTPDKGITAEVLVVKDFDELEARKAEVPGKIVLFDAEFVSYGVTSAYRNTGPAKASALGAVAVLVRSITPFSIDSPHTGHTQFNPEELRLPAAAITLENSNLIARLAKSGQQVVVNFRSGAKVYPPSPSRNLIADIPGSTKPYEYVTISGHIDSWDVGQGAMDDAGGAFLAWNSLALIKHLNLPTPARTLRSILWTSEEFGLVGSDAYRAERENEVKNWTVAFESDMGLFDVRGIGFAGNDEATCIMQEIASMFGAVNGTEINQQSSAGSDIESFQDLGIPMGEPFNGPNEYFWYHHSNGDWIDVLKTEDLDRSLAIFTSTIYILADLSVPLPKSST